MKAYLTPPELAKLWQCKPSKIIAWIRSGELEAINLASSQSGRPRYRITREAVTRFERRRAATAAPRQPRRYKKPKRKGYIEFIK